MTNAFASIAQGLNEAIRLGVSRELLIKHDEKYMPPEVMQSLGNNSKK